jgi:hypothetical protein
MEEMETLGPNAHHTELNVLKKQMDELLYKEEIMWLQPSRIAWLKEGDRNTNYFHRKAGGRAREIRSNS